MKRKSSNKYPFIVLLMIHSALLLYTFRKQEKRKTLLVLLLSHVGLGYIFEILILNLLDAYKYLPKIFKNNYLDNIFGAILSQAIYIPFTAVFISGFHLKWKAKLIFLLYFQVVERLFIRLKLYKTFWWSPLYTTGFLAIFFPLSDKWYELLQKGNRFILNASFYLCTMGTEININYLMAVFGNFRMGRGKVYTWREHFLFTPLYGFVQAHITTWFIRRDRLRGKIQAFVIGLVLDWVLYRCGFLKVKNAFIRFMVRGVMVYMASWFRKFIYREIREENEVY